MKVDSLVSEDNLTTKTFVVVTNNGYNKQIRYNLIWQLRRGVLWSEVYKEKEYLERPTKRG